MVALAAPAWTAAARRPPPGHPRRAAILDSLQRVMGPLPGPGRRAPLDVRVHGEQRLARFTRYQISYASEPGDRVPAYLLVPRSPGGRRPAVLCLHQTTPHGKAEPAGVAGHPDLRYAEALAERGFVTLAPDAPGYGSNATDPYALGWRSATLKIAWDDMRALDLLEADPRVDPRRIGAIGHSLGGFQALVLAAFDSRVRAVVSSCGFTSFRRYAGGNLAGYSAPGGMPLIRTLFGDDAARMPFDLDDVLTAIAPRPVLVIAPERDGLYSVVGVAEVLSAARPAFEQLGAPEALASYRPASLHHFPPQAQRVAFDWLAKRLGARR